MTHVWRATAVAVAMIDVAATATAVALQASEQTSNAEVTFTRDISPIIFSACASCHHPGGPGPFGLTTYDEVRRRATQIAQVTKSRFMPPWKVEPGVGHFVGQRLLTYREIALIAQWASNGEPVGDPKRLPASPIQAYWWLLVHHAQSYS